MAKEFKNKVISIYQFSKIQFYKTTQNFMFLATIAEELNLQFENNYAEKY